MPNKHTVANNGWCVAITLVLPIMGVGHFHHKNQGEIGEKNFENCGVCYGWFDYNKLVMALKQMEKVRKMKNH